MEEAFLWLGYPREIAHLGLPGASTHPTEEPGPAPAEEPGSAREGAGRRGEVGPDGIGERNPGVPKTRGSGRPRAECWRHGEHLSAGRGGVIHKPVFRQRQVTRPAKLS